MRAFQALGLCLLLLSARAILAQSETLPEPDFAAIARMAQRVEAGKSYVAGLPARRQECRNAAIPYLDTGVTQYMAWGGLIVRECHAAMLIKLAESYYKPDAFGPGGMSALLNNLQRDLGALYYGIYQGRIDCLHECGSMAILSEIADNSGEIEHAAQVMASLHVPFPDSREWFEAWKRAGWGE